MLPDLFVERLILVVQELLMVQDLPVVQDLLMVQKLPVVLPMEVVQKLLVVFAAPLKFLPKRVRLQNLRFSACPNWPEGWISCGYCFLRRRLLKSASG